MLVIFLVIRPTSCLLDCTAVKETGEILPIARSEYGKLSYVYFDQGENEYYIAVAEELPSNLTGLVLVGKPYTLLQTLETGFSVTA